MLFYIFKLKTCIARELPGDGFITVVIESQAHRG